LPQWHGNQHKRKKTGGRRKTFRTKRAYEAGSELIEPLVGKPKKAIVRCRGGRIKTRLLKSNIANVTDPSINKSQKVEITRVIKNQANVDFQRKGVITKGAIIETPIGNAVVTSRPGQDGTINATLIKKS
jgi:small subunit ribosomal protein S8e